MSFDIFCAGTPKFNYEKKNCLDQSDFDTADLISKFQSLDGTAMGVVATAANIGLPSAGMKDASTAYATMQTVHLLSSAVNFVALEAVGTDGWIFVMCRQKHWMWPDTCAAAKYSFSPGDNPGTEFIKAVAPALKATGLDNWGVLLQMAKAISQFSTKVNGARKPMLSIDLTH